MRWPYLVAAMGIGWSACAFMVALVTGHAVFAGVDLACVAIDVWLVTAFLPWVESDEC